MSRLKNIRNINIDKAESRMAGMRAIDSSLDLGDNFTVVEFEIKIKKFHTLQEDHNTTLSKVDEMCNASQTMEK
jgi:hypothetical protein